MVVLGITLTKITKKIQICKSCVLSLLRAFYVAYTA